MRSFGLSAIVLGALSVPGMVPAQGTPQPVTGSVKDAASRPIAGAEVVIGRRVATTNSAGGFRFDAVAPGEYTITVRFVGYWPIRSRIVVLESKPTELAFLLTPTPYLLPPVISVAERTGIYGLVGDSSLRPLAGVRVEVLGFLGGEALTDSLGHFAFPRANLGTYMIRVSKAGYSSRMVSVEVPKGRGREVGFRLMPGSDPRKVPGADEAIWALGRRLALGKRTNRMDQQEIRRFGSMRLCDVPKLGVRAGAVTTVVLNGVEVLREVSLCAWRMDEIELVELCDEGGCPNPAAPAPLIYPTLGRPLRRWAVVIWEKR